MKRTVKIALPVLIVVVLGAVILFTQLQNEAPLQGRDLLTDPAQLASAVEGKTRDEIRAILGEPDASTNVTDVYSDPDGEMITFIYVIERYRVYQIKTEKEDFYFSLIERTEEAQALIDDLDLLAETVEGMTISQVIELLGEFDRSSATYRETWYNSRYKATVIGYHITVEYVSSEGRTIYLTAFEERSEEVQSLLDDVDALAEALRGLESDREVSGLLGTCDEQYYNPVSDPTLYYRCYRNLAGEKILIYLNPETGAPISIVAKGRTILLKEE